MDLAIIIIKIVANVVFKSYFCSIPTNIEIR